MDHILRPSSSSKPCQREPFMALISSFKEKGDLRNKIRPPLYSKVAADRMSFPLGVRVVSLQLMISGMIFKKEAAAVGRSLPVEIAPHGSQPRPIEHQKDF